ncbi:MAG: UDP-N-acetylmuramoyl-L-alanyl-D-glutamate--2,6-diaminopimelate ligase [Acidobacteria bacterium]|nr:UDP-N-acetylmuramoyl-L-alanyl-D-glutamate--2,6-diaminopimelate ligase [Acidobacteriota bacterium]MBV9069861.1 UDP-N-acetylmuramoyl-L-alanyl-D-glutamate--2,6-diaminopimelate ligase [Acidobacteriota bacterium]MBV9187649.1 UDP-N-acetylmuramoyl-L-alanyl-D-glutamate--2,6-diaminopimelate ligase [Acidobacteriota bacterium]
MKLRELLKDVPVRESRADLDVAIASVTADSRMATPGALFVAIPGLKTDGAKFIESAIRKGAAAIVGESSAASVQVDDTRAALSIIAANYYGRPADKLSLVGVTGTSGKTTTTKMIESIFDAAGGPVGLVGTIEYRAGDERLMADRTTPDAVVLQQWFAKMVDAGVRNAVMEVSSHALALKRTYGIHFAAAVFTNLSQDHFDFHKDFEDYFAAKRILFDQIDRTRKTAIVNIDDEYGRRLANELGDAVVTFGRGANADIHPLDGFEISVRGLEGRVATPAGEVRIESKLLGAPNLYNWLGAIGATQSVGIDIPTIEAGIRNLAAVRGRFEYVESAGGPTVIVDYAHKPDALEKLLQAVRDLAEGRRVVLIVGCGGDRDKDKRPKMGAIAARLADYTVLTSDNPRGEKPEAILDDIEAGMRGATNYTRITDRRDAISRTIAEASDDDVVVIAGKGHEPYQVIGDQILHFDDREEAERALETRHEKRA